MMPSPSIRWMRFQHGVDDNPTRSPISATVSEASCCRTLRILRSIASMRRGTVTSGTTTSVIFETFPCSDAGRPSKPGTLVDGGGKRAVDDIGGIELLLDEAGTKIEVNGLLLVGHHCIVVWRHADPGAAEPVERHRRRNVHEPAPGLGVGVDIAQRP